MNYGFIRIAASEFSGCDSPLQNAQEIKNQIARAHALGTQIMLFPELSLSGAISPHFINTDFLRECERALKMIADYTRQRDIVCFVGLPVMLGCHIHNMTACLHKGMIYGLTPKNQLSRSERSLFTPVAGDADIQIAGSITHISERMLYACGKIVIGMSPEPLTDYLGFMRTGANLILKTSGNLSEYTLLPASECYSLAILSARRQGILSCECGLNLTADLSEEGFGCFDIDPERVNYIRMLHSPLLPFPQTIQAAELRLKEAPIVPKRIFSRNPYALTKNEIACAIADLMRKLADYLAEGYRLPPCDSVNAAFASWLLAASPISQPANFADVKKIVDVQDKSIPSETHVYGSRALFRDYTKTQMLQIIRTIEERGFDERLSPCITLLDNLSKRELHEIELFDFFMYHLFENGYSPKKTLRFASRTFPEFSTYELKRFLTENFSEHIRYA